MVKPKINKKWLDSHEWMLRSSNNGVSYEGYRWKRKGAWNTAPDWDAAPECGHGYHGNASEAHGYGYDYGRIELHETRGQRVIIDGDKIKVRESRAVAYGAEIPREAFERCGMCMAHDGDTISPKHGETWYVLSGTVTVEGMTSGRIYAHDHAKVESTGQTDGRISAHGSAKVESTGMTSGRIEAYDTAKVESTGMTSGRIEAYHTAKVESTGMTGGRIYAHDHAKVERE